MTSLGSSGVPASGALAAEAAAPVATLVQPMKLAGAGPQARQNSSEHVSPDAHCAPEVQQRSACFPQEPLPPPAPPVVDPSAPGSAPGVGVELPQPPTHIE